MSGGLHDVIFGLGLAVIAASLIPAVVRRSVVPVSSCALMVPILFCLVVNYATMRYWYACGLELASLGAWSFLLAIACETGRSQGRTRPGAALAALAICAISGCVIVALMSIHVDRGIGRHVHDAVLAGASAVAFVSLVPAVRAGSAMPAATCIPAVAVALLFTANLATMGYWWASATESGNLVCWACLLRAATTGWRSSVTRRAGRDIGSRRISPSAAPSASPGASD